MGARTISLFIWCITILVLLVIICCKRLIKKRINDYFGYNMFKEIIMCPKRKLRKKRYQDNVRHLLDGFADLPKGKRFNANTHELFVSRLKKLNHNGVITLLVCKRRRTRINLGRLERMIGSVSSKKGKVLSYRVCFIVN